MPLIAERHGLLDILRLVAIFGVVCLHQSVEPSEQLTFGVGLRLMFRWCVPFFFLLTGFFLASDGSFPDIKIDRIKRIVLLTVLANLFYLPLTLVMNGVDALNTSVFVIGFWFHLWFLNAMVLGLLLITILPSILRIRISITLFCLFLISAFLVTDLGVMMSKINPDQLAFFRHLSATGFIWIGFLLGENKARLPGARLASILVLIGLILSLAEGLFLSQMAYPQLDRQLPIGALVVAVGMIFIGSKPSSKSSLAILEKIGRESSLPIYIIHPIFLKIGDVAVDYVIPGHPILSFVAVVLFGFFGSLFFYLLLSKYTPALANLLNGKLASPAQKASAN